MARLVLCVYVHVFVKCDTTSRDLRLGFNVNRSHVITNVHTAVVVSLCFQDRKQFMHNVLLLIHNVLLLVVWWLPYNIIGIIWSFLSVAVKMKLSIIASVLIFWNCLPQNCYGGVYQCKPLLNIYLKLTMNPLTIHVTVFVCNQLLEFQDKLY